MVKTKKTSINPSVRDQIKRLMWVYADKLRGENEAVSYDAFAPFMLYCTYVSENHELLNVRCFDEKYSIRGVMENLGDSYVARDFVAYYSSVESGKVVLPKLDQECFVLPNQARAILSWAEVVLDSGVAFADVEGYPIAAEISAALSDPEYFQRGGRAAGEYRSGKSLSDLVVACADVRERSVLDFTCGAGTFLARAEASGASFVAGSDISKEAANAAKIACFFGNPACPFEVNAVDALRGYAYPPREADRIVLAPPVGMLIRGANLDEREYMEDVYRSVSKNIPLMSNHFEDFCVAKAIDGLAQGGKAVVQVSPSFLFKLQNDRQTLRKVLVEEGYLQAVIELPGGMYMGTAIKSALLVLGKERKYSDVLLVDLDSKDLANSDFFLRDRSKRACAFTEEGIAWVVDILQHRKVKERVSALVKPSSFAEKDYNLCYATYGEIVDVEAMIKGARHAKAILEDIDRVRAEVDALSEVLNNVVASISDGDEAQPSSFAACGAEAVLAIDEQVKKG